jgi:hypothetical protein
MAPKTAAERLLPGLEIIDAHAHIGRWGSPGAEGSADEIRRITDRSGFSKVVVSSSLAIQYDVPEGNADVERLVTADARFYGAVTFNAHYPAEAKAQIERYAGHPRFVCAKNHPAHMRLPINSPANLSVIELLAEKRLPLTVHTWTGDGPAAAEVARRFPGLTFLWFHALATDYRKAAELARELPNVYLDFVTSLQESGKVEYLVTRLGADRLVFGTDQSLFSPVYALGPTLEADISSEDRRKILSLTARRLLRFERS